MFEAVSRLNTAFTFSGDCQILKHQCFTYCNDLMRTFSVQWVGLAPWLATFSACLPTHPSISISSRHLCMLASMRIAGSLIIMLGQGDPFAKMAYTATTTARWHGYGHLYHSMAYRGKIRNEMLASSFLNCNKLCLRHVHRKSAMFADLSRCRTQALRAPRVSKCLHTI